MTESDETFIIENYKLVEKFRELFEKLFNRSIQEGSLDKTQRESSNS